MEAFVSKNGNVYHREGACFCVGPQNGEPLCPCQMRSVTVENGRYIRKQDLGPAERDASDWLPFKDALNKWANNQEKPQ